MTTPPIRKPRVYRQGVSVYVIGTDDLSTACAAAGISFHTHVWARTDPGIYVLRRRKWLRASAAHPPQDALPGIVFVGPVREG